MYFVYLALCLLVAVAADYPPTALDEYVWKPDDNYKWEYMGPEYDMEGHSIGGKASWKGYVLNVTSQRWLTDADFSPDSPSGSIWWHMMVVIVPNEIKYKNNATMWVTGGGMGGPPSKDSEDIVLAASLAMGMGVITGSLFQIPNEHTIFAEDPKQQSRTEDAIIAYTWDHFLNDPSQPEWLVRFPMVKASLRAMDAMTDFVATMKPELGCQLDYYVVAGASKRGWTTWLVGAVDPTRVVAIIPIVLDAINFVTVEHHEWMSYGGWGFALQDYLDMNIMARIDDPNMVLLQQLEDPYWYRERLTMPKLIINAGLDEFQHPDDNRYWWNDMPEPKKVIMLPNTEHSCATGILEVVPAIGAWGTYLYDNKELPQWDWEISENTGEIVATLNNEGRVHEASMWWAKSCGANPDGTMRRDFRIANMDSPCQCGIFNISYEGGCANLKSMWTREILEVEMVNGKRTYRASRPVDESGRWTAFFIDIKYEEEKDLIFDSIVKHFVQDHLDRDHKGNKWLPVDKPGRLEFTTQVSIVPNTFPYPDCQGAGCDGMIV